MSIPWTADQLSSIDRAQELEIATRRPDDTLRHWIPIWVVRVDDAVYVRTWYRRNTGWFGHVLAHPRARVRVPGLAMDVVVIDLGLGSPALRSDINAAYLTKYGTDGGMVSDEAAASTLQLVPE